MVADRDTSQPNDPKETAALEAEARGEGPYEPERDPGQGNNPLNALKEAAKNIVGPPEGRAGQDE